MKRKMLAAFLAATMVGGLLVGCGNSGDTSGSSRALLEQHQQHRHLARQMLP